MPSVGEIPAPNALQLLLRGDSASVRAADLRSEGEFLSGSIPRFRNFPILNNDERHQVGICYKQQGQAAAIELGHRLVAGERAARVGAWAEYLREAEAALVCCWRGGLRSRTGAEWLLEAGVPSLQIQGGYKALRRELMARIENLPELLVIAGPTGSNKSGLLRKFPEHSVDLERYANHRGSAFGGHLHQAQPAQATFENEIGFRLAGMKPGRLLVEDESLLIGQLHLPPSLRKKMSESALVLVEMSAEQRAHNIYAEYIEEALASGISAAALEARYQENLRRIEKKLGGELGRQVSQKMRDAFCQSQKELHQDWIQDLLVHYYDKAYAYSLKRAARPIAFKGDWEECNQWIQKQFG